MPPSPPAQALPSIQLHLRKNHIHSPPNSPQEISSSPAKTGSLLKFQFFFLKKIPLCCPFVDAAIIFCVVISIVNLDHALHRNQTSPQILPQQSQSPVQSEHRSNKSFVVHLAPLHHPRNPKNSSRIARPHIQLIVPARIRKRRKQ